jgi:hypothetical protein
MCGTHTPFEPYIPEEFIVELFPTEDGREILHEPCTRTPYLFRQTVKSMHECVQVIDRLINAEHWYNDPVPCKEKLISEPYEPEPVNGIIPTRKWKAK